MTNENLLDQFFLNDEDIVKQLVLSAEINKNDKIIEIGAGTGIVTREIVKYAGEVFAVEIDKKFEKDLKNIEGNFQLVFDDALEVLKNKKKYPFKFNKIVGSLPSSIIEPLMHLLTQICFEMAVFLTPLKYAYKLQEHKHFPAFFKIELISKVSRRKFLPMPKTNWAVVKIIKKSDPLLEKDEDRFLMQYVYSHPNAKLKNALVEGLIRFNKFQGRSLTKNQARSTLSAKNPPFPK